MSNKISELIASFPGRPGVYIMKNKSERPIYIGKAKNLKTRVRSYFHNEKGDYRLQIPYLINEVETVDYIITKNESEALILENSLIKTHKPKYNIRLKDDKTYSSLRLSVRDRFPKLTFTRKIKQDGAAYFGPFASQESLRQTTRLVHKLFPIRDCSDTKFNRHKNRPCLSYYIKLCSGPCAGRISSEEYDKLVHQVNIFLSGDRKELIKIIKSNMYRASEETRFDDAAYYRDQLKYIEKNAEVDKLFSSDLSDKDIIGFYREDENYNFTVLQSRNGSVVDKSDFSFKSYNNKTEEIISEFLSRFYSTDRYIPSEIIVSELINDNKFYSVWLTKKRGKKVAITSPKKGAKLRLLESAMSNAKENFLKNKAESKRENSLLDSIKKSLSIKRVPYTIECFDISNIQGNQSVASLVRFKNGRPERGRYRKYKIKSVSGPNDFASIYEVIFRRCLRAEQKFWDLPDLILIDGGKGQLNAAYNAIKDCGVENEIDIASIAKSRKKDLVDKIYVHGRKNPYMLTNNKKEIFLLMRIRDEAHRFAITFHKGLRKKASLDSALDSVPGVGKRRKLLLLNHFGSVGKIKSATVEEISSVEGINKKIAGSIKQYLTSNI
ncbi:MAG: excinuclease ABC subunit UvrC [Candidatus Dadabacteria bacterium]|nr:excinuclease ABC subunit UvrC [Candidatus Dadabacteria bacterium]NIQ16526.1 excinuclease ABC subunit UvrC [Candidatus Dadabacteria bacterium]